MHMTNQNIFFLFINTKQFLNEFLMIQPKKKEVVQLSQFE